MTPRMTQIEAKWRLLERVIGLPGTDRILLYGPPGTGKTRLACMGQLRHKDQRVFNLYLTEETPSAELRGHFVPAGDGKWVWMHGPGIHFWLSAGRLVLNEINNASGETLDFLLALLDDFEVAGIDLPNGDYVKPKPGAQVIATMNGEPEDLPPALQDRFTIRARLTEAHPDALKALPEDIREALTHGDMKGRGVTNVRLTSVRSWLSFDHLRNQKGVTELDAAELVFEEQARDVIEALTLRRAQEQTEARKKEAVAKARAARAAAARASRPKAVKVTIPSKSTKPIPEAL